MQQKKKILIVDDDEFILNLIEMALKGQDNYEIVKATNGKEALEEKSKSDFDLIITDIIMPEIDGIKFIDELRKADKDTPIIAMSGGDDGGDIDNYINFAHYFTSETLTKPFTKEELLQSISMVIDNKDPDVMNLFY
jgi:CheY-like chemotaxis protein